MPSRARFAPRDRAGDVVGAARLACDYDVLSGHFSARELAKIERPMIRFVLLREPTERFLSHYYFHKMYTEEHIEAFHNPLLKKTKANNLADLLYDEEYCRRYTHFYAKSLDPQFESGEPSIRRAIDCLRSFDVIGITSRIDVFLNAVSTALGVSPPRSGMVLNDRASLADRDGFEPTAREPLSNADLKRIEQMIGYDRELYNFAVSRCI